MAKKSFGGFGGRGGFGAPNMNQLMQQLQKVQKDMVKSQEDIKQLEVEASVGGGMVTARLNGEHRLVSLKIQPEVVNPEDIDLLSDLILSAINEAERLLEEESNKLMPNMPNMGSMGLGGLF